MLTRKVLRSLQVSQRRLFTKDTVSNKDHVRIVEVGPRDGLQNEKRPISLDTKIHLIERLAATGLSTIEAGSFVSPKWVPQMADADQLLTSILSSPQSSNPSIYQWLVPNVKGLDNFLSAFGASKNNNTAEHQVSIFLAATEAFSQKNTNCSIAESISRFRPLVAKAQDNNLTVRAYISVALGCPFQGPHVSTSTVADLAATLLDMGASEISVADTTGMGTVPKTRDLLRGLASAGIPFEKLALHFHDTYGQALPNVLVALEHGVRTFDAAVGGLGGCPFSPGATGNLATEDLVYTLHTLGITTGVQLDALSEIGGWIVQQVGKPNGSRVGKALLSK